MKGEKRCEDLPKPVSVSALTFADASMVHDVQTPAVASLLPGKFEPNVESATETKGTLPRPVELPFMPLSTQPPASTWPQSGPTADK